MNKPEQELNPGNLVSYPFFLRPGCVVSLYLPMDMTHEETLRVGRFIKSLALPDMEPQESGNTHEALPSADTPGGPDAPLPNNNQGASNE